MKIGDAVYVPRKYRVIAGIVVKVDPATGACREVCHYPNGGPAKVFAVQDGEAFGDLAEAEGIVMREIDAVKQEAKRHSDKAAELDARAAKEREKANTLLAKLPVVAAPPAGVSTAEWNDDPHRKPGGVGGEYQRD